MADPPETASPSPAWATATVGGYPHPTGGETGFEALVERPPRGLVRRFLTTQRHLNGLLLGGLVASVRDRPQRRKRGLVYRLAQLAAFAVRPLVKRSLVDEPVAVQLRRRLEILGPTYIKLGQILSLREDILPQEITDELKNLLDRLQVVPFPRYLELVQAELEQPVDEVFSWIDPRPTGSASIAQLHRGTLISGESVILKVVKPGIRETLARDARLLLGLGRLLQLLLPRYQPRRMIEEFVDYTRREADLKQEADNAESFAANFRDAPDIVFPQVYRQASSEGLLTMEYLDGIKPSALGARQLSAADRERLVDLGAASVIRMIYRDGFFHADLHPANLLILPGPRIGFIDLGMVGRFNEELRRTLLYYYYSLVMGDHDSAARYLSLVADSGRGGDPHGFRREVAEICRRWHRAANFREFSLAQLVLASVARGAEYRIYFPVEMVLMVKALVTFEGVGQIMSPGFDVVALSQVHINRVFVEQFNPLRLVRAGLRSAPELFDAVVRAPGLLAEGMRLLEQQTQKPPDNPFSGIRGTIFGGFCFLAGAILLASSGPAWAAAVLFTAGLFLALHSERG